MTPHRTCLALVLALPLAAASARAGGADAVSKREPGVSVRVGPAGKSGVNVLARDAKGMEHGLVLETKDGKVLMKGSPDADRPWLGVLLSDPGEIERGGSSLPSKAQRWTVTAVADGSPAEKAGLQRGDILTGVDGRQVLIVGPGLLAGTKPGDRITLDVERDGKPVRVDVRLVGHPGLVEFEDVDGLGALDIAGDWFGSLEGLKALEGLEGLKALKGLEKLKALEALEGMRQSQCPPGTAPEDCPPSLWVIPSAAGPRLGVSVESMSDQLARYFGATPGHGLLVKDVVDGSPAAKAGIEAGDVILDVGSQEIRVPGDIRSALKGREEGDSVTVDILRRGRPMSMNVILEAAREQGFLGMPTMEMDVQRLAEEARSAAGEARKLDVERKLALERDVARARESIDAARQALEAGREARAAAEMQREREHAEAAGAHSEEARRELERTLQQRGLQVVPSERVIEF